MNENQKAQQYDRYMYEYDKLSNQVSSIKGESFELNDNQRNKKYCEEFYQPNFKLKTINIIKSMALSNLDKDNLTRLFKMINIDDYSDNQRTLFMKLMFLSK